MKHFTFLFCFILTLSIGILYLIYYQAETDNILSIYQKELSLSEQELSYKTVSRSWSGNGLVFHQPVFSKIPIRMQTDRLGISLSKQEISFRLSGLIADIAKTLTEQKNQNLVPIFQSFNPPNDFLMKPLETMALLKQDIFKGNLEIILHPQNNLIRFQARLIRNQKEIIRFQAFLAPINTNKKITLSNWISYPFDKGNVLISDIELLKAVAGYYQSIQKTVPTALQESVLTSTPLNLTFNLTNPISLKTIFK